MTTTIIVYALFFWILPIYLARRIAKKKNRNYVAAMVWAVFFSWLAVIISALQTKKDKPAEY